MPLGKKKGYSSGEERLGGLGFRHSRGRNKASFSLSFLVSDLVRKREESRGLKRESKEVRGCHLSKQPVVPFWFLFVPIDHTFH